MAGTSSGPSKKWGRYRCWPGGTRLRSTGGAVCAYQDDPPDTTLREFVAAVGDHRVGPPDADAVARYDGRALTRRLAGYLDCLAEQADARAAGGCSAKGGSSRRAG